MTNDDARPFLIGIADELESFDEIQLTNSKDGTELHISRAEILAMQTAFSCAAAILNNGVSTSVETFINALFSTHADNVLDLHDTEQTEDDC